MKDLLAAAEGLSPPSQEAVRALIRQLCENEGITPPGTAAPGLKTLEEGVERKLICKRCGRHDSTVTDCLWDYVFCRTCNMALAHGDVELQEKRDP